MKQVVKQLGLACACCALLSGCACGPKEGVGTVGGGLAGALLGAQVGKGRGNAVAITAGALLGSMAGREIGRHLDECDEREAHRAVLQAVGSGSSSSWQNPRSGNEGRVTVCRPYEDDHGKVCREFKHRAKIDGKWVTVRGLAERDPVSGRWNIVSF